MAITVVNQATPTKDQRALHTVSKGLKFIMGDLNGVVTDGAGKFTMAPSILHLKRLKSIQGYGNEGTTMAFLAVDNLVTNSFIMTKADGTALASTDLTGKHIHFTAIGQ